MKEDINAYLIKLSLLRDEAKDRYISAGTKEPLGEYRAYAQSYELARRMLSEKK